MNDTLREMREEMEAATTAMDVMKATLTLVGWINAEADIPEGYHYTISKGRRYIKIVMNPRGMGQSVHAFVDKTNGDLLKPAGWKAPAKGARGNVLTNLGDIFDRFTWAGGYLYKR